MAEPTTTREQHSIPRQPVAETPDSISYLGVTLPKATNTDGPFVPAREQYSDYINDPFSLKLQRDIAVAFIQGDPVLVEGGTSIGKTTTVRKMASDLGYEVHYINLNGTTDVEDLMGRYIPNPNKRGPKDPEYVFADGKVTMGLRTEPGKRKIIVLDEYNSAAPNIAIRLHETLDALERGENVVLTEDASETLRVDKNLTIIVALTNPPGKGYFGREPLDPAQLRRWVYLKAPNDLPADTFSYSTDVLFSLNPKMSEIARDSYFVSRDQALLPEQLTDISGMPEMLAKYKEFHKGAKELLKNRKIAADQPQQFTFDDRMEPRRVRDFVLKFYNGDITETFQQALRYYYSNKLESNEDREALDELIKTVVYEAPEGTSQRRGLKRGEPVQYKLLNGEEFRVLAESSVDSDSGQIYEPGQEVELHGQPSVYLGVDPVTNEMMIIPRKSFEDRVVAEPTSTSEDVKKLVESEKKALAEFFGKPIKVPKPPAELFKMQEHMRSLGLYGFEAHYIPDEVFAKDAPYPGWKVRPNDWFWKQIKDGKVSDEALKTGGHWVLIDTTPKPNYQNGAQVYEDDPFKDILPNGSRFNLSWDQLHNDILPKIVKKLGVPQSQLRLPKAIEFNVLGNMHHKKWGETSTYEWFEDGFGADSRLIGGRSDVGGLAVVLHYSSASPNVYVGFRPLIVF